jgi:hypothetical protein
MSSQHIEDRPPYKNKGQKLLFSVNVLPDKKPSYQDLLLRQDMLKNAVFEED